MAEVYKATCVRDHAVEADNGDRLELCATKDYLVGRLKPDGTRKVFSTFWVDVSADLFVNVRPI